MPTTTERIEVAVKQRRLWLEKQGGSCGENPYPYLTGMLQATIAGMLEDAHQALGSLPHGCNRVRDHLERLIGRCSTIAPKEGETS